MSAAVMKINLLAIKKQHQQRGNTLLIEVKIITTTSKPRLLNQNVSKRKENYLPIRLCVKSRVRTDLSKSIISSGNVCFTRKTKETKVSRMFSHKKTNTRTQTSKY